MVILGDHNKKVSKTSIFELYSLEKPHKQVAYQSRLDPPNPHPIPQKGEKHINTA